MSDAALMKRSNAQCELCGSKQQLSIYVIPPETSQSFDTSIVACGTCLSQINKVKEMDINHWRCLNESMWNEHSAVQIVSWRMLTRLSDQTWAQDALEMMYLDDELLMLAKASGEGQDDDSLIHRDCNGTVLSSGDSVVLIKDLNVKGTSFIAKRGTAVRKIGLVHDDATHIEGRVNSQQIIILTQYVKKS